MNLKEKVMNNVLVMLSTRFDADELRHIRNVLAINFQEVNFEEVKNLPSVDVLNNEKILRHYYATKRMEGLSEKSIKMYQFHINRFLDFTHVSIVDVDTNTVRYYLATIVARSKKSYADNVRRVLNTFFEFCKDEEYISVNPAKKIKHIKQNVEMKEPYTDIEVEMIRDACVTLRERALVSFLFATGARRDEVGKIKMSDLDLRDRSAVIHGKGGKDRKVFFSARCEKHLREYIHGKGYMSEYLFCSSRQPHGKLSNGALASIVKKIGNRSNVPNVHMHRFRHWFGTYMASCGVSLQDLKEMMGHSKIETTEKYYVFNKENEIKHKSKKYSV